MKKTTDKANGKCRRIITAVLCCLLLCFAFLALFSAKWYIDKYGRVGFDSILYTLISDKSGTGSNSVIRYIISCALPAVLCAVLLGLILFLSWDKKLVLKVLPKFKMTLFPVRRSVAVILSIVCSVGCIYRAVAVAELDEYLQQISQSTTIFQDRYIDPRNAEITFPEKKRNLIYIFMESMESTFFSAQQGGALENGAIPELYELAANNVNFSCNEGVGGLYVSNGATWTIAAMVSQTAGIPLKIPSDIGGNDYGQEGSFLPGVRSLTDILHDNGYYQTLMVGSDADFGGRKTYFESHGVDHVYDLFTAREDGIVEPNYSVWWGMEDRHLYRYAQQELTEIAAQKQPFAFYMLTVDTHNIGGYVCPYCENAYANQYENVLACASRQLAEFMEWLQAQDFYEDTSIVIVGDHTSMDEEYINEAVDEDFDRCIYNCFVNSAVKPTRTNERVAFSLDMFPTTLAAMGCTIKGERLGLGTNLFSDTPTLGEEMKGDIFDDELIKNSPYYMKNFLLNE